MEKAYKLLSAQYNISNKKAKTLIDKGLVSANGKKITIARSELPESTKFSIIEPVKPEVIFKDKNILCVNKPTFIESYDLAERYFSEWRLLHRLDKETSGVILLTKQDSDFTKKAKDEFKHQRVIKLYNALVEGIVSEEQTIDLPISTHKNKSAKSKIDQRHGLQAISIIKPLSIIGKKTLLDVEIKTGRTHQIRIHLKAINHPIIGDSLYGRIPAKRLMLHARYIKIFDYEFSAPLPKEFQV